ncbi:hypothetical protein E1B28_000357 [Marasmius oreades]|uniref:Uncharacterized protein n=1 Tax=Marasmius oreades TaxID=181124 RepID=A0A9P8AED3_9AGAR|nr:uncharacterized protein E1B28_000357 [Marasmius oreades]KAG7098398.1 hypothetical protein E1B28_000357 [Marasmius oreades]
MSPGQTSGCSASFHRNVPTSLQDHQLPAPATALLKGKKKEYLRGALCHLMTQEGVPTVIPSLGEGKFQDYLLLFSALGIVVQLVDTIVKRRDCMAEEKQTNDLPIKAGVLLTLQECNDMVSLYVLLTKHGLLPNDHSPLAGDYKKLDELDAYLKSVGCLDPNFARWVPKIFKLFQCTAFLMNISYSKWLTCILSANIVFYPVHNPPPTCSATILTLVDIMRLVISRHTPLPDSLYGDPLISKFIDTVLLPRLADTDTKHNRHFTIHAEIALALYLQRGGLLQSTYPFMGLSKLSCTVCTELMPLITSGPYFLLPMHPLTTHCKTYRSWVYPNHISNPQIKVQCVSQFQKLLLREFVEFAEGQTSGQSSDSTIDPQGLSFNAEDAAHFEALCQRSLEYMLKLSG